MISQHTTLDHSQRDRRFWKIYVCSNCGGVVVGSSREGAEGAVNEIFPTGKTVDEAVPERARNFLTQAIETISSPSASIMVSASAVDSMLKAKGYRDGNLYPRINQARDDHVITKGMAQWAHDIRLDANEPRHADETVSEPDVEDAKRVLDFALSLAEFLFVLPARVTRGIAEASTSPSASPSPSASASPSS